MSIQEAKLAAIAAAIREKDGSTGLIRAGDFAQRILAIPTGGGGSGFAVPLTVTVDPGAAVAAINGDLAITGTAGEDGTVLLTLTAPGVWTVTASLGDKEKSTQVEVVEGYAAKISLSSRLPDGYTELEYIQSDSKVGFDTNIKPTRTTKAVIDVETFSDTSSSTAWLCGAQFYASGSRQTYNFGIYLYQNYWRGAMGSSSYLVTESVSGRIKACVDANTGEITLNEERVTVSSPTINTSLPTISILGAKSGTGALSPNLTLPCKFFSCQIYDGDILIRDFVPCINPQSEIGLFDLVETKFYANASTGTITPGPGV